LLNCIQNGLEKRYTTKSFSNSLLEDLELIKNSILSVEDLFETYHTASIQPYTVDDLAKDLHFIEQSKDFIAKGQNVYVLSSW